MGRRSPWRARGPTFDRRRTSSCRVTINARSRFVWPTACRCSWRTVALARSRPPTRAGEGWPQACLPRPSRRLRASTAAGRSISSPPRARRLVPAVMKLDRRCAIVLHGPVLPRAIWTDGFPPLLGAVIPFSTGGPQPVTSWSPRGYRPSRSSFLRCARQAIPTRSVPTDGMGQRRAGSLEPSGGRGIVHSGRAAQLLSPAIQRYP